MSNGNFAIGDFWAESLNPDAALIGTLRRRARPATVMAPASGAGGVRIVSETFPMSHENRQLTQIMLG